MLDLREKGLSYLYKYVISALLLIIISLYIAPETALGQTATKLQILLPGMTPAPGSFKGYTGEPNSQSVGISFNVIVNAVDDKWNVDTQNSDQVSLTSGDPSATLPLPVTLVNGTATLTITLNSYGSYAISVQNNTNPGMTGATSPSVNVLNLSHFTLTTIGSPWWGYPGQVTAGRSIHSVEIIAKDNYGNRANDYNGYVTLTQETDYGIGRIYPEQVRLEAGKWKGDLYVYRAGEKTQDWGVTGDSWVRVTDNSIAGESNRFCVLPRDVEKLILIVPGETHWPGSTYGKTGAPAQQQVGQEFYIDVYAVDKYWNKIKNVYHAISLTTSDPKAVLPSPKALTNGLATFPIKLNTFGQQTVSAHDLNDSGIDSYTSSSITVLSQGVDHFVIDPISSPQSAGTTFPVTIKAVDEQGTLVDDFSGILDLSVSSGVNTFSPNEIYIANGQWTGQLMVTKATQLVSSTVSDRENPPHSGTSNQFDVIPGQTKKLQVLLPGETGTPGFSPGKTGTVNDILAGTDLVVRVNAVDDWWNVTTSSPDIIHLESTDPQANLPEDGSLINGTRQFVVTMNSVGNHKVTASNVTAPGVANGISSEIRINPGTLDHFEFEPITGIKNVGTQFSVTLKAVDPQENLLENYSGIVSLQASTGDGTMIPLSATLANGTWTGNVTLKKAAESVHLKASDGSTPAHTGTSNDFIVAPGALVRLQVLVPGITATPGVSPGYIGSPEIQKVGNPFAVVVNGVDAYWNTVTTSGDSFEITSTDAKAALPEKTILVNGTKHLSIILNSEGNHTISAEHLNNSDIQMGQTPSITVLPQNLDHFSIAQINGPAIVGKPLSISITAQTSENEKVVNFSGSVNISASTGAGTILTEQIGPFMDGEWSGEVVLTLASNDLTLQVDDGATPSHTGTSNTFSVIPGTFGKLQVLLPGETAKPGSATGKTGTPWDQLTGSQFDVTVQAVDVYWNLVTSASDSVQIHSSDNQATLPGNSKLINGKSVFTVIMGSSGIHTITSVDITDPNILSGLSSAFNVNPGNLDHFIVSEIDDQTAGNEFSISITAADVAGNPVSGFNGHARLQSSTGDDTYSPNEIQFVDGTWNGKITVTKASENVKITCLDYATTPHTGQSNSFKVAHGNFYRLQILMAGETSTPGIAPGKTGEALTQLVGEALVVTVNAVDKWWNPIPTAIGLISLTSTDENANLPMDAELKSGSVTFTDMRFSSPGHWTITARDKSDAAILTDTSSLIRVITGSIASFVFDAIVSPQVAGDSIAVTIRAVDGSGSTVVSYSEMASMTASSGPGTMIVDEIQFQEGVWEGKVILTKAAQSVHLNIHDFADVVRGNSNPFTLIAGELSHLQILLPGETANPGQKTGKTGTPTAQTIGVPFEAEVITTDEWWNPVSPDSLELHFSATDKIADLPADTVQTKSDVKYQIVLLSEGKHKISVSSINGDVAAHTSSEVYVQKGEISHFVFSNIDSIQIAGQPFKVRVDAYNQYNFPVNDYEGEIIVSASTGNGTISQTGVSLKNGFWAGEIHVTRADTDVVLYGADYVPAPNTHTGYSNSFLVTPNNLATLQVLLPGETATDGVTPGREGAPEVQTAGKSITATIRAVDAYWNLIPEINDTLSISVSDSFAIFQDKISLENGVAQFPIKFRAAGSQKIAAQFTKIDSIPAASNDSLKIIAGSYSKLLLLAPGETTLKGDNETDALKTPGRKGKPTKQTSGLPFNIDVIAVDSYWNPVEVASAKLPGIFSTDETAVVSSSDSTFADGHASYLVTLKKGGNQVLRAIDSTNTRIPHSLDAVFEVLVGGLHYQISISKETIIAGDEFEMTVMFKNAIDEVVRSAQHLVRLSAVTSNDLSKVTGTLKNATFNLQSGQRTIKQVCNSTGAIRIKITDDLGNEAAYSDPIEISAGEVAEIKPDSSEIEIGGLGKANIKSRLADRSGNPVINQLVNLKVMSGSGELESETAKSDSNGIVSFVFTGGRSTETNIVRIQVDSIYADIKIMVNLTPTNQPNGIPVNYPNPFGVESQVTHIDYYLAEDADVSLKIYDFFGNLVWTKEITAGESGARGRSTENHPNSVEWDGTNDNGQKVGNGGYILLARAVANGKVIMNAKRKIAVLR